MEYDLFPAWPDVAAHLIEVAAGRSFADIVIRKGQWVNVHTREVLAGYDIAIVKGRIACVCLLYTSPSPRDKRQSRMPSSA